MSISLSSRLSTEVLEQNYSRWKVDPSTLDPVWSAFFEGFELGSTSESPLIPGKSEKSPSPTLPAPPSPSKGVDMDRITTDPVALSHSLTDVDGLRGMVDAQSSEFRGRVALMVFAYRALGHKLAWINPLMDHAPNPSRLSPARFGFSEDDLNLYVNIHSHRPGSTNTLQQIIDDLRSCYCGFTGFEFMHINNVKIRNWIQNKIEERDHGVDFGPEYAKRAMRWLLEAENFEAFLGKKFLGEKRFSLEGGEGLMVLLNSLLESCPKNGVEAIEMGMAHRGRLNVLANFMRKSMGTILYEFTPNYLPDVVAGDGDVKYHLGYEKVRHISGNDIHLSLAANPSHLEAGDPIVEGKARARQRILKDDATRHRVLPLLIHGDAAFAGQGLVAEVFNLSQLRGYRTGGTIHIVVNNQIGFTTMPADARSSNYATDIAKMVEAPILHVNGEKPMELIWASLFALEFRQKFSRDIVIDMYCYRRLGHNETDQTAFTAPTLAKSIEKRVPIGRAYRNALVAENIISEQEATEWETDHWAHLEEEYRTMIARSEAAGKTAFSGSTAQPQPPYNHDPVMTGVSLEKLKHIGSVLTTVPEGFRLHPILSKRFIPRRQTMIERGQELDWAFGESLAWGALLMEGYPVRLSGQDCRRGTFSQRHAVFYDYETRSRYIPLKHLDKDQAKFRVFNSALSEASVLGFEYGYSLGVPEMLTMWEAQFGDFANGAQVIIDQFIVSAEAKWQTPSSIVLLLPHGYDGQGPEHSSARLERFLQLCADDNIQVMNLTTSAQYFHALRRQKLRPFLKPLILMTPKSMLTLPEAVSSLDDFTEGTCFHEILRDPSNPEPSQVKRVIFCSGKVYYDLDKYRKAGNIADVAIIRLEQIYPLHCDMLAEILLPYAGAQKFVWCQEEPANMGAWNHIHYPLEELLDVRVRYAGRPASPSPAEGAKALHKAAQAKLVSEAYSV